MDIIWVFPGLLDLEKLKHVLAQTRRDYPHAAGRLLHEPSKKMWQIRLTNESIPISTGSTPNPGIFSDEFNHEKSLEVLDSLKFPANPLDLVKEPLVRFKLTSWEKTGETSLSVSFCHMLGDATTVARFIEAFSNYYQDLPPPMVPTFEKYFTPDPTLERDLVKDVIPYVPYLATPYELPVFFGLYNDMMTTTSRVDIKLSLAQLKAIKSMADETASIRVSTMDALVGYFITVLNRVSEQPIEQIVTVADYRGAAAAGPFVPPPKTSVGNPVVTMHSDKFPADTKNSIGYLAGVNREILTRMRNPETLRRLVAMSSELLAEFVETRDRMFWWGIELGGIGVNNLGKSSFASHHFGYQGQMRFYFYGSFERYLRIYPANPERLPDGSWKTYDGGVDVCFRVKHSLKAGVIEILEEDFRDIGHINTEVPSDL
jgi:hypothetical protein